ncbi:cytochrome b [Planctobacterium marinum]|uniref:Cytochrome b n=1 Tax=Planctobacterium marinum TaxID=1631968 RepID=A0AA48HEU6_9ALTE|nr:cytochrome b [Planctobacterium marinum]
MSLRNSDNNYGSIAKWIHWLTALLFLAAYISVYYRQWFTEAQTPENWTALQLHLSFGVSIAVIVILRIVWKVTNPSPAPEPGTALEHLAAKLGHIALYAIMIIMPITGYLGTGVATEFFYLFDIPSFKDTALFAETFGKYMEFADFEKPLDFIHKDILGAWLVWLLIAGHAGAALYHHFVKQDRTLKRMTTGK